MSQTELTHYLPASTPRKNAQFHSTLHTPLLMSNSSTPSHPPRRSAPTFLLPDIPTSTAPRGPARPTTSRPTHGFADRPRPTGPSKPRPPRPPALDPSLPHDPNFRWGTEAQSVEELEDRARLGDLTAIAHAKQRFGREGARRVATAAGYRTDVDWAMLGL